MSTSHLINANVHRMKEGARVLEDVARFILRDDALFMAARRLRHGVRAVAPVLSEHQDLGISVDENNVRANLLETFQANVIRMQEALRVLEELSTETLIKNQYKYLRYQTYQLQADYFKAINTYLRRDKLCGLYLVIDPNIVPFSILEMIDVVNQTDVHVVQYRDKVSDKRKFHHIAQLFKSKLDAEKLFIVNDHLDVALDVADGVHLGQNDFPIERVRSIVPDNFIFGVSCHNLTEAEFAYRSGASYIATGCVFGTRSKPDTSRITLQEIATIKRAIPLPICPIGGINSDNLESILALDIGMVAMITYVWTASAPIDTINLLHKRLLK